jgi:hypothetical protein
MGGSSMGLGSGSSIGSRAGAFSGPSRSAPSIHHHTHIGPPAVGVFGYGYGPAPMVYAGGGGGGSALFTFLVLGIFAYVAFNTFVGSRCARALACGEVTPRTAMALAGYSP